MLVNQASTTLLILPRLPGSGLDYHFDCARRCHPKQAEARRSKGEAAFSHKLALELDGIAEQGVAPCIKWPLEVRLGVDTLAFALHPFPSVGLEREVLDVVIASLFPMVDRQWLAVMLALKIGPDVL